MPVATRKQGRTRMAARDVQFAKGAHLRAVRGELRPAALLSGERRIRCLLDFGKRQQMRQRLSRGS